MFNIESYITPILLSYVDKYVKDFNPADAQVSLWGGGVVLHNLVLKADVLQQEVALPFTLVSGRIHELLIQVPWTKIMSEPIQVTIDTIECILSLHRPSGPDENPPPEPTSKAPVVEAPPGYMQALVRRVVSNIALRVHHLIVKYSHDDVVLSLNVKHLAVNSAGVDWKPAFADIDQNEPVLRRLFRLDDLTLCLDKADSDGKIRYFQEPLLYRCQLDVRVLTHLVSAGIRRVKRLSVQLICARVAWGVTSDQMALLLRLLRETETAAPLPRPKPGVTPFSCTSQPATETDQVESWSAWAWSWLPGWADHSEDTEESIQPCGSTPVHVVACLDCVSLVFKVMETDSNNRKRPRSILELTASHVAFKSAACAPTTQRVRIAIRDVQLCSLGRCVCGLHDGVGEEEAIIFLNNVNAGKHKDWTWPPEALDEMSTEDMNSEEEESTTNPTDEQLGQQKEEQTDQATHAKKDTPKKEKEKINKLDSLLQKMAPVVLIDYSHDRSPPDRLTDPYEDPPQNFEYSDWVEARSVKVDCAPVQLRVCGGLLHRLNVLQTVLDQPAAEIEMPVRALTVEECDALTENLPLRQISVQIRGWRIRIHPWEHTSDIGSITQMPAPTGKPVVLDVEIPAATLQLTTPLYPHRVCSAACQMPDDSGPLWQGARMHVSVAVTSLQMKLSNPLEKGGSGLTCARLDVQLLVHRLLFPKYFKKRRSVETGYSLRIREGNICGSAPRLQAACQLLKSLITQTPSDILRYASLAKDALHDQELVAIDVALEEFVARGFVTAAVRTHIILLQAARATALHKKESAELKQAWLVSAPDASTANPYLRLAVQWCVAETENALEYVGLWTEPTAISVDPLLVAWLAYAPRVQAVPSESTQSVPPMKSASSQYFGRRRHNPPSSSGRGASARPGQTQLVHSKRTRSQTSSERAEATPQSGTQPNTWWDGEKLLELHARLKKLLISVEMGVTLVYVTASSASAIGCGTLHDAMERHAAIEKVLVLSLGRVSVETSIVMTNLWNLIKNDGPTYFPEKLQKTRAADGDSFPWKLHFADISCYTLEVRDASEEDTTNSTGLLSSHRPGFASPKTLLELTTTTVTLTVVIKQQKVKVLLKPAQQHTEPELSPAEQRIKYFKAGQDFKPTTLKEFVRGPAKRTRPEEEEPKPEPEPGPSSKTLLGPVVSLGVNVHADTPPLIVRIDHDQVHSVGVAIHCFEHIVALLNRTPPQVPTCQNSMQRAASSRSLLRSTSDTDTGAKETPSEEPSDLLIIFDPHDKKDKLKLYYWFQWVVSRLTVVCSTRNLKMAFELDDIISTVDLQVHYNQLKIKVASASVRHYQKHGNSDWSGGPLGGRVLDAREPADAREDAHFLALTITQARISNLPDSWKEELHPKILQKCGDETMWEIYATLAPLDVVLLPSALEQMATLAKEMDVQHSCPMRSGDLGNVKWHWPFFCYVTAGGLRLILADEHQSETEDDCFLFSIERISVNPHPENPICRRTVTTGVDTSWNTGMSNIEGRQYEVTARGVALHSGRVAQILSVQNKEAELMKGTGAENPALKWTQPLVEPVLTPILHPVNVSCVLAPAHYVGGMLLCGPAFDFSLQSDCSVELLVEQLWRGRTLAEEIQYAFNAGFSEAEQELAQEHVVGEKLGICPYAEFIMQHHEVKWVATPTLESETTLQEVETDACSLRCDSGVGTELSQTTLKMRGPVRKTMSVLFLDNTLDPWEYLEVMVTTGSIELSLYQHIKSNPQVVVLSPYEDIESVMSEDLDEPLEERRRHELKKAEGTRSLQETPIEDPQERLCINKDKIRNVRDESGNMALLHAWLHQPNLYYWRTKAQNTLQVSIFDAWVGLGTGRKDPNALKILYTARGDADPLSDIPPAMATLHFVAPKLGKTIVNAPNTNSSRGTLRMDVEKPIMLEVSEDHLKGIKNIINSIKGSPTTFSRISIISLESKTKPPLYRLKRFMVLQCIESITLETKQVAISGAEGTAGWDSTSLQISCSPRGERLRGRGLVNALMACTGPPYDTRHVLLQPVVLGVELEATWEAWQRAEGGLSAREPMVAVNLEVDRIVVDMRPCDLSALHRIRRVIDEVFGKQLHDGCIAPTNSAASVYHDRTRCHAPPLLPDLQNISSCASTDDIHQHYYQDDLRSGAFKIMSGGQLPMAYQVALQENAVAWRYPHPRALTRIVAFPLPGIEKEVQCVLEVHNPILATWELHTSLTLPVSEPKEINLSLNSPDAVFAKTWRIRILPCACVKPPTPAGFHFDIGKFLPNQNPLSEDRYTTHETRRPEDSCKVTAEQLVGVIRVDSYFAPALVPRVLVYVRGVSVELHAHNDTPQPLSNSELLEGYYVSRPMMRSHRILSISATETTARARFRCAGGIAGFCGTTLASDVLECSTGTMEPLMESVQILAAASQTGGRRPRVRAWVGQVRAALRPSRMRVLRSLLNDWSRHAKIIEKQEDPVVLTNEILRPDEVAAQALEGLISLWVKNSTSTALRIGQQDTDELLPLPPGTSLAYRWYDPATVKRLRFAIASPTSVWAWSKSVPFYPGSWRIRLEGSLEEKSKDTTSGMCLYVRITDGAARRTMHIEGRLTLANMLRSPLLYKVRARSGDTWRTLSTGGIEEESIGRTVLCDSRCDMMLKVKFASHDAGWSGDIPLKECPKQNVPWLVKVPSSGEVSYVSVWCRVVCARSEDRLLAAFWPLYLLQSHLPLDVDVTISTEGTNTPPLVQSAAGRGTSTHILATGTTTQRHSLVFQYKKIDSAVTRDAVPLHYGVTDSSVFERRAPAQTIDPVIDELNDWLEKKSRRALLEWPYSLVRTHWPETWMSALLQPRCDVTVRYSPVCAGGGGCSLQVSLCPVVLACNASQLPLTLRAHDATPLCRVEPGTATSPPPVILQKPFYISVEIGRETFVSGQLEILDRDPGRYGSTPPGKLALDRHTHFSIFCGNNVALLTMYYEIKENINVLGISSTFILINRLDQNLLVSAVAVPKEIGKSNKVVLKPKTYIVAEPTKEGSKKQLTLSKFSMHSRWRGSDPSELRMYICVSLASCTQNPTRWPVPVRLGRAPLRRPIALVDADLKSHAVVVTQMQHEGRWVVTVADDPCPQFMIRNRTPEPILVAQANTDPAHTVAQHKCCLIVTVADDPCPHFVIRNRTLEPILVVQANTAPYTAIPECSYVKWWCSVEPKSVLHYSTPSYCKAYPPLSNSDATIDPVPMLTFAKQFKDEISPSWCPGVAVDGGVQLVQLSEGCVGRRTVKLTSVACLHTSLLDISEVGQDDISASDIRQRLMGVKNLDPEGLTATGSKHLQRVDADVHYKVPSTRSVTLLEPGKYDIPKQKTDKQTETVVISNIIQPKRSTNEHDIKAEKTQETAAKTKETELVKKVSPSAAEKSETSFPLTHSMISDDFKDDIERERRALPIRENMIAPKCGHCSSEDTLIAETRVLKIYDETIENISVSDKIPLEPDKDNIPKQKTDEQSGTNKAVSSAVQPNRAPTKIYIKKDKAQQTGMTKENKSKKKVSKIKKLAEKNVPPNETKTETIFKTVSPWADDQSKASCPLPHSLSPDKIPPTRSVTQLEPDKDNIPKPKISKQKGEITGTVDINKVLGTGKIIQPNTSTNKTNTKMFKAQKTDKTKETELVKKLSKNIKSDEQNVPPNETKTQPSLKTVAPSVAEQSEASFPLPNSMTPEWDKKEEEPVRVVIAGVSLELSGAWDARPLVCLHVDRIVASMMLDYNNYQCHPVGFSEEFFKKPECNTTITIGDVQVDNLQYESGQFDFGVVACTRAEPAPRLTCPLPNELFGDYHQFTEGVKDAQIMLRLKHEHWSIFDKCFNEMTEVELRVGPIAMYVEDAYISALASLARELLPSGGDEQPASLSEARALQRPLLLRSLLVHELQLTLTLHTAVRMYIALDQSPLTLGAFRARNLMTSTERLTHTLTVHYLSAAILGAGWVVGGLELLGAPGALMARVGEAQGVGGVASAAAAALLRCLSAWCTSLAANLDLLVGDTEHTRRAAEARRRPPASLLAGLATGITNFAINLLGAVGGLAQHPVVGVGVGQEGAGMGLRRGLLGALAKPLAATADLVAFAGNGLLTQTGWDPTPQRREYVAISERLIPSGWRRDCVRWSFRLAVEPLDGVDALLDETPLRLLPTTRFLVVVEPETERVVEMIDLRGCTLQPYREEHTDRIELRVTHRKTPRTPSKNIKDEEDEYQVNAAAMARVARFTGTNASNVSVLGGSGPDLRTILLMSPARALSLRAMLAAAIHHNSNNHLQLMWSV